MTEGSQTPKEPSIKVKPEPKPVKQTTTHTQQNMKLFWEGSNAQRYRSNILNEGKKEKESTLRPGSHHEPAKPVHLTDIIEPPAQ